MTIAPIAFLDPPIRVLFVCSGNSARSQIAEALLEQAEIEATDEEKLYAFRRTYLDLAQWIRPFVETVLEGRAAVYAPG